MVGSWRLSFGLPGSRRYPSDCCEKGSYTTGLARLGEMVVVEGVVKLAAGARVKRVSAFGARMSFTPKHQGVVIILYVKASRGRDTAPGRPSARGESTLYHPTAGCPTSPDEEVGGAPH